MKIHRYCTVAAAALWVCLGTPAVADSVRPGAELPMPSFNAHPGLFTPRQSFTGRLVVGLRVVQDCSVTMPPDPAHLEIMRMACSDSVSWLANLTSRDVPSSSFVTLQFADRTRPLPVTWADSQTRELRMNLDY